jgi:hypothetical protein
MDACLVIPNENSQCLRDRHLLGVQSSVNDDHVDPSKVIL